jgi:acyl carrier protein
MSASLRALLAESIDFAGVFPPAKLPLEHALRNYLRYLNDPAAWLIGRFVCPATQIANLNRRAQVFRNSQPWQIREAVASLLGVERKHMRDFSFRSVDQFDADSLDMVELVMKLEEDYDLLLNGFDADKPQSVNQLLTVVLSQFPHRVAMVMDSRERTQHLLDDMRQVVARIVEFHWTHGDYAKVDSLELRLPDDVDASTNEPLEELVCAVRHQLQTAELQPISVMIEIRPSRRLEDIGSLLEALDVIRDDQLCLKIRAGGLPRDDMPSAEQFAFFIDACRASKTRWKATAGLHHPLSCFDSEDRVWHFGFLNVFAAAVLASTKQITQDQIKNILTETSRDAFAFDAQSFSCNDLTLTIPDIEEGRRSSLVSFGSCSFDEPRHGLRDLLLTS